MYYLLALTAAWLAFAVLYRLLLAKETFFTANRYYLLTALLGSLALPWAATWLGSTVLPFPAVFEALLPAITVGIEQPTSRMTQAFGWPMLLLFVWLAGIIVGMVRCVRGLLSISRLARAAHDREGRVLFSTDIDMPFSFFGRIFVPTALRHEPALDTIVQHELAHVHGLHSLDVLLSEVVCIVFWWHPLVHWYRCELRLVHEFIADAAAVRSISRKQYGLLLIGQAQSGPVLAYANHFLQSPLKQRLIMLSKQNSAPVRGLRYALALPLLALLVACFGPQLASAQAQKDDDVREIMELQVQPTFAQGGEAGLMKYLADNIVYPEDAKKANISGVVAISFVINTVGTIEDIRLLKAPQQSMGDEAMRVIKSTRWIPGQADGKHVKVRFTLPIKFKMD